MGAPEWVFFMVAVVSSVVTGVQVVMVGWLLWLEEMVVSGVC